MTLKIKHFNDVYVKIHDYDGAADDDDGDVSIYEDGDGDDDVSIYGNDDGDASDCKKGQPCPAWISCRARALHN